MSDEDPVPRERITDLLASWVGGDRGSGDRLFAALYQELQRLARHRLRGRPPGGTLDTAGLIHDAYLRLVDEPSMKVNSRGHFLALTSRVMRQIVVDHARRRQAEKRGGGGLLPLDDDVPVPIDMSADDILSLDEALSNLEALEPRAARLVDLRYFGGLTIEETAGALEISVATAKRDWERARAYLYHQLKCAPGA
jgi:RNA polymerase sigma factor (TIGR02999 family)